ncbi:MAG: sigma-54-dependent transcriptional regulator [Acidobacteriota bacterium]
MNHRVLIVDDEAVLVDSMARYLSRRGFVVETAADGDEAWERLRTRSFDAVATDIRMPRCDGLALLARMRDAGCSEPAIVMSAHHGFEPVVAAMKAGARDFLRKPVDLGELETVLRRSMAEAQVRQELAYLRARDAGSGEFTTPIGSSVQMRDVRSQVKNLARAASRLTPAATPPFLITGETGTGKGLVARYYHRLVSAGDAPFIEVNCTNLQPTLVESELFGHERGAFTDAKVARKGLFEAAEGGTLYLDEIGHLQPGVQGNLLTAIEEKTIRPVGGSVGRPVNVRIVATTNVDLEQAIEDGCFRSDLYFRLSAFQVQLCPLRERRDDIPALASAFLRRFRSKYGGMHRPMSDAVARLLDEYDWPGNVRELKNVLERAVVLAGPSPVDVRHLRGLREEPGRDPASAPESAARSVGVGFRLPDTGIDLDVLADSLMEQALVATGGNITAAARMLGITRSRFRSRRRRRQSGRHATDR